MQQTLAWHLKEKEIIKNKAVIRIIGISCFFVLTAVGAFVYIPLPYTPVPITLQTFFVLLTAMFLRKKDGLLSQSLYVGFGALGLPIFSAAQGGLLKLFGPTGGYIFGFVFSVIVISSLLDYYYRQGRLTFLTTVFTLSCGIVSIYLFGGLWLSFYLHFSPIEVFMLGIAPFVLGDILKVIFAAYIYTKVDTRFKYIFK